MTMRGSLATLIRRLGRYFADTRAVAAVEFALILPPLLILYVGSLEASSLITVDRRVQIVSGTIGDLVARWDPDTGAIPSATLTDYFTAAETIIHPYDDTDLEQAVSVVRVLSDGTTQVVWSCGFNGGQKRTTNSPYALETNLKALAQNGSGYVVASETWYDYEPVLGIELEGIYHLYAESFYLPRYELVVNGPTC